MVVYTLNINTLLQAQTIEQWFKLVPSFIEEQVLRYRFEKDRLRVLGGKLLIKHALNTYTEELKGLKKTDKGRLYFKDVDFDFNISHSGDMVVLAFAVQNRIGIDIELHRKIGYENFERNFTAQEWETILSAKNGKQQFFDFWAIKESVIKADGRGFEVLSKTSIQDNLRSTLCDGKAWKIRPIVIESGYSSCVAMDMEEDIEVLTLDGFKLLKQA